MFAVVNSVWYIKNFNLNWSRPWAYIYQASYLWVTIVGAVPIMWYVLLAQMVLAYLSANNAALIQTITVATETEAVGKSQKENLRKIYEKSLTLRKLYKEMERVLSIALLGSKIHITVSTVFNVFYIVHLMMNSESWNYLYISVLPTALHVITIVIMGQTADNIAKEVSHSAVSHVITTYNIKY